jgi:hypothetical protein
MSEPLSIPEPTAMSECDVCSLSLDELPVPRLFRCSVCKNRFFCVRAFIRDVQALPHSSGLSQSTKCQKADWKSHKFDCSPLSSSAPATIDASTLTTYDEDVQRASTILKEFLAAIRIWDEAHKEDKNKNVSGLPESKAIRGPSLGIVITHATLTHLKTSPSLQLWHTLCPARKKRPSPIVVRSPPLSASS